jgi:hypothetical protein
MTTTRPMFPHVIDSTMLSTFRSCPRKMELMYAQHWKPKGESVHLRAGKAFAAGIEAARRAFFEHGKTRADAEVAGITALITEYGDFQPPSDSAKTVERMAGALEFYLDHYPLGADGALPIKLGNRTGIEFNFAEPLDILHPVTGNPIIFTGRADLIGNFGESGVWIFDEKTTSQLGASWGRQWELRSQFTAYCWAARQNGIPVKGAVVRGVSILKTKYDHQQIVTYRPEWEVQRWYQQTIRDIRRMIQCWEAGYWDWALDHACTEYGGCVFAGNVCKSEDPSPWLPMYFERKVWDPLKREEVGVEEYEKEWE